MFSKQWWLGLRIWLLAVTFNTLLGTVYLTFFSGDNHIDGDIAFLLLFVGSICGAVVSLPAIIFLVQIINRCLAKRLSGKQVFRFALITSFFSAVGAWLIFTLFSGWGAKENTFFLLIAIVSGMGATATQYSSILRLAQYEDHQFENV